MYNEIEGPGSSYQTGMGGYAGIGRKGGVAYIKRYTGVSDTFEGKNGQTYFFKYFEKVAIGIAQQDWSPDFVNDTFGADFRKIFGMLTWVPGGSDKDHLVRQLQRRLDGVANKYEYYLIPEVSNPTVALRPVSYQIRGDGISIQQNLVDPATLNRSKLWGNPGTISAEGAPSTINYTLDDGRTISLVIFFQRPFSF